MALADAHVGLIVWKIRRINKETAALVTQRTSHKVPRTRLEQAIRIIIESGMLYTLFVILTFITELAGSNAIYGVSDMVGFPSTPHVQTVPDARTYFFLTPRRWSS